MIERIEKCRIRRGGGGIFSFAHFVIFEDKG